MRTHQFLSIAAAAATVQAINPLQPRDLAECYAEATDILASLTDVPTPDATLVSYIIEQTQWATITGSCELPVVTGSLGAAYTSYIESVTSWAAAHSTDLDNLLSACSDVPEVTSALNQYPGATELCSEYTWVTADATGATTSASTGKATTKASSQVTTSATATSTAASTTAVTSATSAANTPNSSSSGGDNTAETQSANAAPQKTSMALAAAGVAGLALAGLY